MTFEVDVVVNMTRVATIQLDTASVSGGGGGLTIAAAERMDRVMGR